MYIFLFVAGFRRSFRLSRKNKKINKSMYECKKSEQYDTADVPTYEEVTPYRRQIHDKYRLIVLVGKCLLCKDLDLKYILVEAFKLKFPSS
jgi:hypothetical protein